MIARGAQLALLGSGDAALERLFHAAAERLPAASASPRPMTSRLPSSSRRRRRHPDTLALSPAASPSSTGSATARAGGGARGRARRHDHRRQSRGHFPGPWHGRTIFPGEPGDAGRRHPPRGGTLSRAGDLAPASSQWHGERCLLARAGPARCAAVWELAGWRFRCTTLHSSRR